MRTALLVVWEASDRVCGKRLRAILPVLVEAMERHGHLALDAEVRRLLLAMSAATIDRALRDAKGDGLRRHQRRTPPTIRRSVPIRTFSDWDDPPPGFVEADLVAHSGPRSDGSFVQTLVLTDIATGWTECAPLLVREQTLLVAVLKELRRHLPFELLGFDTDNDTVFMNETVRDYCSAEAITFTRCRPYRKNDQAWVEQKNGAVARRIVGYRRFEGFTAAHVLAELYAAVRLHVNFFQPSFKLAEKHRDGARVHKRYHAPATPCQRLLADPRTPDAVRERLEAVFATLDPLRLLRDIRAAQQRLVDIADMPGAASEPPPSLDTFLSALRTAWRSGRRASNRTAEAQAETRTPATGPARGSDRGATRMVRRGAMAHQPGVPRQAAERASGPVSRRTSADRAAAAQDMAFGARVEPCLRRLRGPRRSQRRGGSCAMTARSNQVAGCSLRVAGGYAEQPAASPTGASHSGTFG